MTGPIRNTKTCLTCQHCFLGVQVSRHRGDEDTDYLLDCDKFKRSIHDAEVAGAVCTGREQVTEWK